MGENGSELPEGVTLGMPPLPPDDCVPVMPPDPAKITPDAVSDKSLHLDERQMVELSRRHDGEMTSAMMHAARYVSDYTLALLEGKSGDEIKLRTNFAEKYIQACKKDHEKPFSENEYSELKENLVKSLQQMAGKLAVKMKARKASGTGEIRYFTASFEPSREQEIRIKKTLDDAEFLQFISSYQADGQSLFPTPDHFATYIAGNQQISLDKNWLLPHLRGLTALPGFNEFLAALPDTIGLADLTELANIQTGSGIETDTPGLKMLQLVADLAPYRLIDLNIASLPDQDFISVLPEFRKLIAVAGVRPDIVGLFPMKPKDREASSLIDAYIALVSGKQFGKRPFLDIAALSREERETVQALYTSIREGRVGYHLGEIKIRLLKNRVIDGEPVASERFSDRQISHFEQSLGYRAWGMVQQLLAVEANEPDNSGNLLSLVREISNPPPPYRFPNEAFQALINYLKAADKSPEGSTEEQSLHQARAKAENLRRLATKFAAKTRHPLKFERFAQLYLLRDRLKTQIDPLVAPRNKAVLLTGSFPIFEYRHNPESGYHEIYPAPEITPVKQSDKNDWTMGFNQRPTVSDARVLTGVRLARLTRQAARLIGRKLSALKEFVRIQEILKKAESQDPGDKVLYGEALDRSEPPGVLPQEDPGPVLTGSGRAD